MMKALMPFWIYWGLLATGCILFFRYTHYVPFAFSGSSDAVGDHTNLVCYRLPDWRCGIAEREL